MLHYGNARYLVEVNYKLLNRNRSKSFIACTVVRCACLMHTQFLMLFALQHASSGNAFDAPV